MDDVARDMLLDYLYQNGDPEELEAIEKTIMGSKAIREECKKELKILLIERSIDGVMTTVEEEYFEEMLLKDKEMVKELSLYKRINEAIETGMLQNILVEVCKKEIILSPEKEKEVEKLYKKLNKEKRKVIPLIPKTKKWIAAASIAVFMLFSAGIGYKIQTRDSLENRLYAKYYEPYDKNGGYMLNSSGLNVAQQYYKNGKYEDAYLLFNKLPSSLHIKVEKHFFMGLSLMEMNQYQKAIQCFNDIDNYEKSLGILPEINWYKALCYLKTGEIDKAEDIFREIVKNNGTNYRKASLILKKLG